MTKRRRMKMAEEQAAIDAAERDAASEERKRRRGVLMSELGITVPAEFTAEQAEIKLTQVEQDMAALKEAAEDAMLKGFMNGVFAAAADIALEADLAGVDAMPPLAPPSEKFPDAEVRPITGSILRSENEDLIVADFEEDENAPAN